MDGDIHAGRTALLFSFVAGTIFGAAALWLLEKISRFTPKTRPIFIRAEFTEAMFQAP
jgi:hypothetical protein